MSAQGPLDFEPPEPRFRLSPASRVVDGATNFFWPVPDRIWDCGTIQPLDGPFDAADTAPGGFWDDHFRLLHEHGVDVAVLQFHGFGSRDPDTTGRRVSNFATGRNMEDALWLLHYDPGLAATDPFLEARPPFLVYYSIPIRTRYKSLRCLVQNPGQSCGGPLIEPVTSWDFRDEWFRRQMTDDFREIKDRLLLEHRDNLYLLRYADGSVVTDERGLPRVPVALYLSRRLVANDALRRWVEDVREEWARDGLAPAFVLDNVFYEVEGRTDAEKLAFFATNGLRTDVYEDLVRAFGSSVVALTSFNPIARLIGDHAEVETMGDWVPVLRRLYRGARWEVEANDL
ncbi:MAG: hypothetical protein R3190_02720, partial [Thermoanaerobaculia bacterium]|nr:hypothetical protein [Thermoanaerobaculia bacterium]